MKNKAVRVTTMGKDGQTVTHTEKVTREVYHAKYSKRKKLRDIFSNLSEVHSYAETLAYMTGDIYGVKKSRNLFELMFPADTHGYVERLNEIIAWAQEFELLNAGRVWDGEWYEELEMFTHSKLDGKK